jgi:RNA polymerase sporulation-specific sigma factor
LDYKKLSDNELVEIGNSIATEEILNRYKTLVNSICRQYFLLGAEQEDLVQEGMIGLYEATTSYKQSSDATFKTFATICIKRQVFSAVRKSLSQKNLPLNSYLSINNQGSVKDDNDEDSFTLITPASPEILTIKKDNDKELWKEIRSILSKDENIILSLYLEGFNYNEIAQKSNKSSKEVDNILTRIKKKIVDKGVIKWNI